MWCGVAWRGVVCCAVLCFAVLCCAVLCCALVWSGVVWCGVVLWSWVGVGFAIFRSRFKSAEASEASPALLAIPSFSWFSFGFPRFFLLSLFLSRFLLLCFSACSLALSFEWCAVPSLSLAFPCFFLPALAVSRFTLYRNL